jgi:hypothetical protein
VGRAGDRLLRASLIVPSVALAFVGPVSMHAPFALVFGGPRAVDGSTAMSFLVVGFAQLVLAGLLVRRACRLVDGEPVMPPSRMLWIVLAASCVAGILAHAIPAFLTAITALAGLPLLYRMRFIVEEERRDLAD